MSEERTAGVTADEVVTPEETVEETPVAEGEEGTEETPVE